MKSLQTFSLLLCTLALAVVTPLSVSAETVLRIDNSVSVEADQSVADDFYAAGGTVSVSGEIGGDAYVVGGTVTTNGPVLADLSMLTGNAQIHASVTDDVRVVAGEVVIAEHVGGDVFVIGGLLKILSTASIAGDVFFYGGEVEISGEIGGSVFGTSESVRIDAPVKGGVDVKTTKLTLGDRANVEGDVAYVSIKEMNRSQNAVVLGEVVHNTRTASGEETTGSGGAPLISLMMGLFAVLCLYLLFAKELRVLLSDITQQYGKYGLIGLGAIILLPIISVFLMVTVLGFWIGLLGLFACIVLFLVSFILTPVTAGALLSRLFGKTVVVSLLWIIVGVVSMPLLMLIPVLGPFTVFALFIITLGAILYRLYKMVT